MKKINYLLIIMIMSLVFIPISKVKAETVISEVTVRVDLPKVGNLVLPEGYAGTDYDNIVDDGTMNPDTTPSITSLTDGVIIHSKYYIVGLQDRDELFFGQFKKGQTAYADVWIECESSEYRLADPLTINIQYTKGTVNYTVSPAYQSDHISTKSGYNIDYTEFATSFPIINEFTVTFDSQGGSDVPSQTLTGSGATESATVERPEEPTKPENDFRGWFTDPECTDGNEFDFSVSISDPITLYAKWEETTEEYTITNGDATATFRYDKGYNFDLRFVDLLTLTPEQIEEMSEGTVTPEMYNEVLKLVKERASKYGEFIGFYGIEIEDTHVVPNRGYGGQVKFKLKMTEEMKKYKSFKFIYMDSDNNFKVGDIADFTIEGDYIVGTLPHLSAYALVGITEEESKGTNPPTGDNIYLYFSLLGLAAVSTLYVKKKMYN